MKNNSYINTLMLDENSQDQRYKDLFLLQCVIQKINSILDPEKLLEEIVGDILETFGYCRSGILFIDEYTNELVIAAVRGWTKNYHVKGDRFKVGKYGITGHVAETGKTYYAPDVKSDPYYEVSEESTNSEIDIPLTARGKVIGVFNIQHTERNAFSEERIHTLETLAVSISIAIENARLFQKERLEKERMKNELCDARRIQLNLLPKDSPVIPGFNLTGICSLCRETGGDWYDYIPLKNGRFGIVLADVSGKGMGAALLMASTRGLLRLLADSVDSPGEVLKKLNSILLQEIPATMFITLIYAVIDPRKGNLVFANAGHLYPIRINSTGSILLETSLGMPLGIADGSFSERSVEFSDGDRLLFYTDGITEAMNKSSEEFGIERLKDHFKDRSATAQSIIDEIKNFSRDNLVCDDVTVVMIEKKPGNR